MSGDLAAKVQKIDQRLTSLEMKGAGSVQEIFVSAMAVVEELQKRVAALEEQIKKLGDG